MSAWQFPQKDATKPNPFGGAPSSEAPKTNLFSNAAASPSTGLFGSNTGGSGSGPSLSGFSMGSKPGTFGIGGNTIDTQKQTNSPQATSPFSASFGQLGGTSNGFGFGKQEEKKEETGTSGFATPNKPASASMFGNFGNTSQAPTSSAPPASTPTSSKPFAWPTTTPAGPPPPSNSLFGGLAGQAKPSLFGAQQPQAASTASDSAPKPSLFGNPAAQAPGAQGAPSSAAGPFQTSSAPTASAASLFGAPRSATPTGQSSNVFGTDSSNTPAASITWGASGTQQPTPSLFARTEAPKTTGLSFPGLNVNKDKQVDGSAAAQTTGSDDVQATSKPAFSFPSSAASSAQSIKTPSTNTADKPNPFGAPATTSDKPSLFNAPTSSSDKSNSFGAPASASDKPNPFGAPTSSAPSNLFGSVGGQKTSAEASASTTAKSLFDTVASKPPATSSSDLFGSLGQNKSKEETAANNLAGASSAAPASGATTSASASTLFGATSKPATSGATTTTADATSTFGASTAGPAPTPQSRLKNKSMDEIITRWASDLSKYQKEFQAQAEKVASWDRMLLENGNAISKLYSKTFQAERDTVEVQKQLTTVEGHQAELSAWLDKYEKEVDDLMARQLGQGDGLQGPDQERERTYKIAERVTERLEDMGKDLTSMIEEINDATARISKTTKPDDPLSQIVRVLNGHLSQLQLIDQGAADLQAKVSAATRDSQRLGSRGNGFANNDNVDHFYRSFMRKG